MDLFRLPKFAEAFFRSQRAPSDGPVVFIASYWTPASSLAVRVFSNCEEVSLSLNDALVERRRPDADRISSHLAHPPVTFRLGAFRPGLLEAVGYVGGQEVTRHTVRTPRSVESLTLRLDESGRPFGEQAKDVGFLWAALEDGDGTVVHDAWENVSFGATGDVTVVGANPFSSEAGIASILVQAEARRPRGAVYALGIVRDGDRVRVLADALGLGGEADRWDIRVTTDGSEPGADTGRYPGPFPAEGRVRAGLFVAGRRVAGADTETPKFRIAGSKAPV
jgi:hypothetical protein